jgi:hypothetical protein
MSLPVFSPSEVRIVKIDTKISVKKLDETQLMFEFAHLMAGHMQDKDANGFNMGLPKKLQRRQMLLVRRIFSSFF